jgi:hypothetical protein
VPIVPSPIEGEPRAAARTVFGWPARPGRVVGRVAAVTNADPQVATAGVLAATGAQGKVVTVYATGDAIAVTEGIDLGPVRSIATDGPNVCASDRRTLRCARVDGSAVVVRPSGASETAGLWGGPGVLLRGTRSGLESGLEASEDGFESVRWVALPRARSIAAAVVETKTRWTAILLPNEGGQRPRYGLTLDAGTTPLADFGTLDRSGWSSGDRLWPDQLVTSALSTETVIAERGEPHTTLKLPWAASGAIAFARRALLLFGRGPTGAGGFLLVELPSRRITSIVPPGGRPIVAAGRVGRSIVAIHDDGAVVAWE